MDDERLIARLRAAASAGEPRPEFVDALHAELATRLDLQQGAPAATARRRPVSRFFLVAATVALLVALVVGGLVVGSALRVFHLPTSVLQAVRAEGSVRVAVRIDRPQIASVLGSFDGFDVDVARSLSGPLGVETHLVPVTIDAMLSGPAGDWQIGLPSRLLTPSDLERFAASRPYYAWPVYLVTVASSTLPEAAALAGQSICATSGSAGEVWLEGTAGTTLRVHQAPPPASVHLRSGDAECLDELRRGDAAAMVTDQLLLSDLASSPDLRVVGDVPIAYEPRSLVVPRAVLGEAEMVAELNRIVGEARSNGTLAELSRRWFGGQDLTLGIE
ncbi:MAG TPA: transporter substrate-binding domain-containing protein [Candidatus Limnocylindrales bacterium]|nr:transporter substrate-binding domain-containing protein [Candidatus Limnocylindrales bacterium]